MIQWLLKRQAKSRSAWFNSATSWNRLQPEQLLLQGSDESLDASVALGLAHEGRARLDARSVEVVLEGVRDEPAAVVVA